MMNFTPKKNMHCNLGIRKNRMKSIADLTVHGKPSIVVGAGPSLDKNVHLLKRVDRSKVVIYCTSGALGNLVENEIDPDYVTISTTGYGLSHKDCLKFWGVSQPNIPLVASIYANWLIICLWGGSKYFVDISDEQYGGNVPADIEMYLPQIKIEISNVAFFSVAVAKHMMAPEVVLIGVDMEGEEHCKHYWRKSVSPARRFERSLEKFKVRGADFGVKVTNCTEGGILGGETINFKDKMESEKWLV